ncbi:MAG: hypothetical protein CSA76_06735 [Spirochaetales bacterium]|nr:MAG: hypothetical protein CSA76_06735 [Spirochaetales bacterium]
MADIKGQIMTLPDVAEALMVSEKTVVRMLQDGSIPGFKVSNQWRFHREDLKEWLEQKRKGTTRRHGTLLSSEADEVPLSRLTDESLIVTGIRPGSAEQILNALAAPLAEQGIIRSKHKFVDSLLQREQMMSTGIGGGAAIPHIRHPEELPAARPALVIGTCPEGIDWKAIDDRPVKLFLLPVSADEVSHLRLLSLIRKVLLDEELSSRLIQAAAPHELISLLLKYEVQQHSLQ